MRILWRVVCHLQHLLTFSVACCNPSQGQHFHLQRYPALSQNNVCHLNTHLKIHLERMDNLWRVRVPWDHNKVGNVSSHGLWCPPDLYLFKVRRWVKVNIFFCIWSLWHSLSVTNWLPVLQYFYSLQLYSLQFWILRRMIWIF